MKPWIGLRTPLLCLCLLAPTAVMAQEQSPRQRLSELSIEDLMNVEVVTASRTEERLTRATSVMSVITAREIERAGFRTIYEVLARVPGFFPTSQATWKLAGTRGLVSDGNDHTLLLIDGHPQNSIVAHGSQQQDQIPALEKVERIEIIRGPGSVLWGGSAANAIINVVTSIQCCRAIGRCNEGIDRVISMLSVSNASAPTANSGCCTACGAKPNCNTPAVRISRCSHSRTAAAKPRLSLAGCSARMAGYLALL